MCYPKELLNGRRSVYPASGVEFIEPTLTYQSKES